MSAASNLDAYITQFKTKTVQQTDTMSISSIDTDELLASETCSQVSQSTTFSEIMEQYNIKRPTKVTQIRTIKQLKQKNKRKIKNFKAPAQPKYMRPVNSKPLNLIQEVDEDQENFAPQYMLSKYLPTQVENPYAQFYPGNYHSKKEDDNVSIVSSCDTEALLASSDEEEEEEEYEQEYEYRVQPVRQPKSGRPPLPAGPPGPGPSNGKLFDTASSISVSSPLAQFNLQSPSFLTGPKQPGNNASSKESFNPITSINSDISVAARSIPPTSSNRGRSQSPLQHERRMTAQFPEATNSVSPEPRNKQFAPPPTLKKKLSNHMDTLSETTMVLCTGENQYRLWNSEDSRANLLDTGERTVVTHSGAQSIEGSMSLYGMDLQTVRETNLDVVRVSGVEIPPPESAELSECSVSLSGPLESITMDHGNNSRMIATHKPPSYTPKFTGNQLPPRDPTLDISQPSDKQFPLKICTCILAGVLDQHLLGCKPITVMVSTMSVNESVNTSGSICNFKSFANGTNTLSDAFQQPRQEPPDAFQQPRQEPPPRRRPVRKFSLLEAVRKIQRWMRKVLSKKRQRNRTVSSSTPIIDRHAVSLSRNSDVYDTFTYSQSELQERDTPQPSNLDRATSSLYNALSHVNALKESVLREQSFDTSLTLTESVFSHSHSTTPDRQDRQITPQPHSVMTFENSPANTMSAFSVNQLSYANSMQPFPGLSIETIRPAIRPPQVCENSPVQATKTIENMRKTEPATMSEPVLYQNDPNQIEDDFLSHCIRNEESFEYNRDDPLCTSIDTEGLLASDSDPEI